jgi:LysR family pca operon transcriptional activator
LKRYLHQRLKIRQLRAVAAIASHGSLSGASQALGVSQPALTKTLREIEDLLGVRIFERHARGMFINDYGRLVADGARQILNTLRDMEEGFARLDDRIAGSVVIGALPTAATGVMPDVLRRLRASDPDINIEIIENRNFELTALLALGEVDLIVGRLYPADTGEANFVRIELYEETFSFIVGPNHPLAAKEVVTPADLAEHELYVPSSSRIHAEIVEFLAAHDIKAKYGVSTTSLALLRELLFSGDVLGVLPRLMMIGDVLRGSLRVLKFEGGGTPPPRPAGIVYRADRPLLPAAQRLSETIADYAREVLARTEP